MFRITNYHKTEKVAVVTNDGRLIRVIFRI